MQNRRGQETLKTDFSDSPIQPLSCGEWIADELLALYGRERLAEMDVDVGSLLDGLTEPEPPPVAGKTDSDEVPDVDESPRSVRGQIYACGEHRLMCADSTVAEDVARLANNCALIVTDPPYGVDYGSQAGTIENDDLPEAEFERFLYASFSAGMRAPRPGAAFYVFHADSRRWEFLSAMRRAEMTVRQVLVWVKETFTLGRQDYQWRHEPCIYGWKDGFIQGTHAWPERDFCDTLEQGYREVYEIDPSSVIKAAKKLPSAAAFLREVTAK